LGDIYKNAVPSWSKPAADAKRDRRLGAHKYPHFAIPNRASAFCKKALRWWDACSGHRTALKTTPEYRAYLDGRHAPATWNTSALAAGSPKPRARLAPSVETLHLTNDGLA